MRTRVILATVPLALVGVAVAPSFAAPKAKAFTKTYTASAPVPGADLACDGTLPMGQDLEEIKIPAAGKIKVDLSDFLVDWDLHLASGGKELGVSQQIQPLADGETVTIKVKKALTLVVNACNYNGGPDAKVTVAYTPS